jgi:benzil reductase ((S)-benzoin forming)
MTMADRQGEPRRPASTSTNEAIVWITGATAGVGAGLARTVPFPSARVINISRRPHPELETVHADLTDPESWSAIATHVSEELDRFRGSRAIFVHNAFYRSPTGFVGEVDRSEYVRHVMANVAAPLVIGDAFVRACRPGLDAGLVMISSGTARVVMEGRAAYGAAKAAMEQWVRAVRAERARRGSGPWVVAVRPGSVDSEALRAEAEVDPRDFPVAPHIKAAYETGEIDDPDMAGRRIWSVLPPAPDSNGIIVLGAGVVPMAGGQWFQPDDAPPEARR